MKTTPPERTRRVCILSGGGDAPGVNAILRAFVHAAHRWSIDVIGSRYGFEGLLDPRGLLQLGIDEIRGLLPKGGSVLGCSSRLDPFFVGAKEGLEPKDCSSQILSRLHSLGIECLVLIGGDGTMRIAQRLMNLGMPCIGVPKTIDNDLGQTDLTVGFDSAVETATRAIDSLHSTAEAHARVMILEVMGRNSGLIALHSGVAGGADVILVPEIPYRLTRIIAKIRERELLGLRFSIIAVAEGATPVGGELAAIEKGRPGHPPRLGGAGERLVGELESCKTGQEVRLTVLGHLQRGGAPSAFDRNLGIQMGFHAAELCRAGAFGQMVAFRNSRVQSVPLDLEVTKHKGIDLEGPLIAAGRMMGIEFGD